MTENNEPSFVYFRDRAKDLGCDNVYELSHPSISHGAPIDPDRPDGEKNWYKMGDLSLWKYIIKNQ